MENNNKKTLYKFVDEEMQRNYWATKMYEILTEQINPLIESLKSVKDEDKKERIHSQLESLIAEFCAHEKEVIKVNNGCSHDIILYLGKIADDLGYGECIMCKGKFNLENVSHPNREFPENILDVEGIVPPKYACCFDGKDNVLAKRARAKLLDMAGENEDMSLEEAIQNILEDLVYYTDLLSEQEVHPRSRKKFSFKD